MKSHAPSPVRPALAGLALIAAGLAGCIDSDTPLVVETTGGALFDRYVALGNSITAGFQSGGIHVEFQREAYPVLLAQKAGARFGIPALNRPGCPPPLDHPLGEPIADASCARVPRSLVPPPLVQNLAVPGADVSDATDPVGTGTPLNGFLLGGRTQVGAMLDANPTLVSVWLGNNDALGPALAGDTAALTPVAEFAASFDEIVAAIATTDADAFFIGVVDAAAFAPALQPGAYFHAVATMEDPPIPVQVSDNCAFGQPGGLRLVSFRYVQQLLTMGASAPPVDCAYDAPGVLNEDELEGLAERVATFNAHIRARAEANGWIYVDPAADLVGDAAADPTRIRKCQDIYTATNAQEFGAAVMSSCPVMFAETTGAPVDEFFGSYISFDAVHPSGLAHETIADRLAEILNEERGLALPTD